MCIVIVEDDQPFREILVELLADAGFDILEAATVDAALLSSRSMKHVELIITTATAFGALEGSALIPAIRERFLGIPVVLMSGQQLKVVEVTIDRRPIVSLVKPFRFATLLQHVERLVGARLQEASC